jgi:hypothetical protein
MRLSIVQYLFINACCHSSVNNILANQILLSNGLVFHLIFGLSVFIKLPGILATILTTFGATTFHINVSGASINCSPKLAVLSAT